MSELSSFVHSDGVRVAHSQGVRHSGTLEPSDKKFKNQNLRVRAGSVCRGEEKKRASISGKNRRRSFRPCIAILHAAVQTSRHIRLSKRYPTRRL